MELNINIMNRLYRYILAVAAIAAAASCAENIAPENPAADNVTIPENLEPMVFASSLDDSMQVPGGQPAASVASRTTYASRKVYWEETDKISVFSIGETETVRTEFGIKTLSDDRLTASFEGFADAQASAFCAVYPHHADNAYDNGTLTVNIPSEQTAVAEGFDSGANVSVAYSANNEERSFKFKNATSLLCIKFTDENDAANTQSITFKAKKSESEYWGLSGQAQLTLGAENVPVVSEGDEQQVTLLAPADGFVKDAIYYVPVYPVGECTGFVVTFTDLNGDDYTKTKNAPGSLDRNWLFNFGSIPGPYDDLPSTFEVELNFVGAWPFEGEGPVENQVTWNTSKYQGQGDLYIYNYTYQTANGDQKSIPLEFKIARAKGTDTAAENQYTWISTKGFKSATASVSSSLNTMICIPGINNRYLVEVGIYIADASKGYVSTALGLSTTGTFTSSSVGQEKKETIFYLYNDKITSNLDMSTCSTNNGGTKLDAPTYLRFRRSGLVVSRMYFKYTQEKPGNAPTE